MSGVPRRTVVAVAVALAVWTGLAVSLAASDAPWSNEAWCAIPAVNLATHGYMGTTVLVSKGIWLVGIERHTYWIMPLHALVQALPATSVIRAFRRSGVAVVVRHRVAALGKVFRRVHCLSRRRLRAQLPECGSERTDGHDGGGPGRIRDRRVSATSPQVDAGSARGKPLACRGLD